VTGDSTSRELLVVDQMTRKFGGLLAVDAVSLTIYEGECVGLIGPNGAGKTTFFNAVSGFDRRRGDSVVLEGQDISRLRPSKRASLGLVRTFQGARVFSSLTVQEHLWIAEHGLPIKQDDRRRTGIEVALNLAEDLGLPEHNERRAKDLPYGLLKVLGIVMSASVGARLLMLDEPVAGMSEDEAVHVETAIRKVRETGVSVWIIDHHLDFLRQLVDRMVVMNFGKKIAEGTPTEVLSDPAVQQAYVGS
jgi:branched-chain amino acid transport system ATP-binding protein